MDYTIITEELSSHIRKKSFHDWFEWMQKCLDLVKESKIGSKYTCFLLAVHLISFAGSHIRRIRVVFVLFLPDNHRQI